MYKFFIFDKSNQILLHNGYAETAMEFAILALKKVKPNNIINILPTDDINNASYYVYQGLTGFTFKTLNDDVLKKIKSTKPLMLEEFIVK